MLREEYLRRLVEASPVELYLSGMDGARIYWPWRMLPPKSATKSYRNACERFIVDSDPQDDTVTANDCLDKAYALNAEVCSLQDVYLDKDATVDAILDGLEVADSHKFEGQLLLPLQKPYVDCWQELGRPTNYWIGIGGLKDATAKERIKAATQLRKAIGPDVKLHGFGWGIENGLADFIRTKPCVLDSLDYSTPMQSVDYSYQNGTESKTIAAMQAATQLVTDLRKCTDYIYDTKQETLL